MENKSNPNKCVRSERCVQCSTAGFISFLVSVCASSHRFLRFTWIFFHDGSAGDFIFITLLFTLCADFILPSWSSMDRMRQKSIRMGDGKMLMIRNRERKKTRNIITSATRKSQNSFSNFENSSLSLRMFEAKDNFEMSTANN